MKGTQWYKGDTAKAVHERLKVHTDQMCADLFPGFTLTHTGFNRMDECDRFNTGRDEIKIVLHLRPIGEVAFIEEALNRPDWKLLE
jgi:hypothetical protein